MTKHLWKKKKQTITNNFNNFNKSSVELYTSEEVISDVHHFQERDDSIMKCHTWSAKLKQMGAMQ